MGSQIFTGVKNLITYIFDIRWHEIPKNLLYLGVLLAMSYIAGMIVVGFPCTLWRTITKKENTPSEAEEKVTFIVSAIFAVAFLLLLFA